MANYIGNQPSYGEFKRLDSISSSFNGSTTTFNLTYNSVSTPVGDASQLIVSLNGIIQEPLNSYTLGVGGSSIVFSSAPASGDTCFIMYIGGAGGTVTTISDGSVTASKLDASLKDYYEDEFTANGSTTDFTLSRDSIGVNQLLVTIDGIVQPTSAYTASGTTLTISPALPNGTNIRVVHMGAKAGVFVPQSGSVGLNELDLVGVDTRYYTQTAADATFETISNVALKAPIANPSFTGNVGIGTISPQRKLSIANGGPVVEIDPAGGANGPIYFNYNRSTATYLTPEHWASAHIWNVNGGTEAMRIDSTGSIGIGTAGATTFSIIDTYTQRGLQIKGNKESGTAPVIRLSETGSGKGDFEIRSNRNGATSGNILQFGEGTDTFLTIRGDDDGGSTSTRGNVGIGTISPTARLGIPAPLYTSSFTDGMIRFQNPDVAADSCIQSYHVTGAGSDVYIGANSYVSLSGSTLRFSDSYASSSINVRRDGDINFNTNTSAGNPTMRVSIDSEGRVTMPYQPSWQLRPNTSSNLTIGSGLNTVGWTSSGSGTYQAHIKGVTLSGSSLGNSFANGNSTGRLTVPVSGYYKIWITVRLENTPSAGNIYLYVNGSEYMRQHVEDWAHHPYEHGFISAILGLSASDYIEIGLVANGGIVEGTNDTVNWFSGHLIG